MGHINISEELVNFTNDRETTKCVLENRRFLTFYTKDLLLRYKFWIPMPTVPMDNSKNLNNYHVQICSDSTVEAWILRSLFDVT
jgi:hypothetical protein